ncbi:MAG: peptidase domain-containing protein [Methanoregula sp.]|jgi:hypothetical protein
MKISGTFLITLICAVMLVSGVSAQNVEINNGYIVRPVQDLNLAPLIQPMSAGTISQGQTVYYSKYVSSGTTSLTPDLYWGDTSDSLTLTITAPDATFGPYSDASDGTVNGRIYLSISKTTGLTPGTWNFRVYGERVTGTQSYSFVV